MPNLVWPQPPPTTAPPPLSSNSGSSHIEEQAAAWNKSASLLQRPPTLPGIGRRMILSQPTFCNATPGEERGSSGEPHNNREGTAHSFYLYHHFLHHIHHLYHHLDPTINNHAGRFPRKKPPKLSFTKVETFHGEKFAAANACALTGYRCFLETSSVACHFETLRCGLERAAELCQHF